MDHISQTIEDKYGKDIIYDSNDSSILNIDTNIDELNLI